MSLAISKVDNLLLRADKIIWMKINALVTELLQAKDNPAKAFACANGGWGFFDSESTGLDPNERYAEELASLIEKYDGAFKLTGAGLYWKLIDGKVICDGNWE
ncbi:hypothetical protein ABN222_06155 [Providencia alcalifaciens]